MLLLLLLLLLLCRLSVALGQIPQYVTLTAGEILFSVTGLEFCFKEAPESMKSVVQACWLLTTAAGNLLTVIFLESATRGMGQVPKGARVGGGEGGVAGGSKCFSSRSALLAT